MTKQVQKPVVTIIGAGSRIFGFNMCTDMCQTRVLKGTEVRLVDVDAQKLDEMKRLFELVSKQTNMDLNVKAFADRKAALPGTEFAIISVARDRINRWDTDLAISRKYGFVEAQAECGGPGGLSLTLRNIPLMLEIARDIEKLAPKAVVLNFSNPMTRVCTALTRYTRLQTVGLCHGIHGGERMLTKLLGRPVTVRGCGTNHFNWVHAATWSDTGDDAWPAVVEAFSKSDLSHWKYTRDLFDIFGWLIAIGDGHISDFIHHWRGDKDGFKPQYGMVTKEMESYRRGAEMWDKRVADYLSGAQDPMANKKGLSGEGAIPIIATMSGISPAYEEIAVNIPNKGYITNLQEGGIVEVPARVSKGRIRGAKMGALPTGIASLCSRQLDIAELAVEAAVEGSREKALQALAIDPLITDLHMARSYLKDILEAHKDLLPQFKS
jgi:alpha-galactosidase